MALTLNPVEVRASEIARGCDRMSVLRGLGTEPVAFDPEQNEWFQRGHLFEQYVARQLERKHGPDNVRRQIHIRHPLGVGHADALIVSERILVEIKSTTSGTISTPVFENGVAQLRFYLRFCDDADEGALYMINPSTLKPADVFRVALTDRDVDEIDQTVRRIQRHIELGVLPDRVCARPQQGRGYFCPFVAKCFEGWEEPEVDEITDADVVNAAARYYAIIRAEAEHAAAVKALADEKADAKAALLAAVPERSDAVAGPYRVKTWPVDGRRSVSVKALEAAGVDASEFVRVSAGYTRLEVSKAGQPGEVDYGDEAPF